MQPTSARPVPSVGPTGREVKSKEKPVDYRARNSKAQRLLVYNAAEILPGLPLALDGQTDSIYRLCFMMKSRGEVSRLLLGDLTVA